MAQTALENTVDVSGLDFRYPTSPADVLKAIDLHLPRGCKFPTVPSFVDFKIDLDPNDLLSVVVYQLVLFYAEAMEVESPPCFKSWLVRAFATVHFEFRLKGFTGKRMIKTKNARVLGQNVFFKSVPIELMTRAQSID